MVGPLPASRPWTKDEEKQLLELLLSGIKAPAIARKLKRSTGAIYARTNSLKKKPLLANSLPSERALFFHARTLSQARSHQ